MCHKYLPGTYTMEWTGIWTFLEKFSVKTLASFFASCRRKHLFSFLPNGENSALAKIATVTAEFCTVQSTAITYLAHYRGTQLWAWPVVNLLIKERADGVDESLSLLHSAPPPQNPKQEQIKHNWQKQNPTPDMSNLPLWGWRMIEAELRTQWVSE